MSPDLTRSSAGAMLALALAVASARAGSLSRSGAIAAVVVGTLATSAGWGWCTVLLAFFVPSSVASRWRRAQKAATTDAIVDKAGARDAWQVAANGGVFAACALGAQLAPGPAWALGALGALAAATADTWATEVGTAVGGPPVSLRSWRRVPAGTSGAVTLAGTLALLAGAGWIGTIGALAGFGWQVWAPTVAAGVAGAMADTVLGATLQVRRWCPRCGASTERRQHPCGMRTEVRAGWRWLTNDAVNALAGAVGGAAALLLGAR